MIKKTHWGNIRGILGFHIKGFIRTHWGFIGVYRGYIGIMQENMERTV